ncbi:MAG: hypothetical protein K2X82_16715 [Gemmataceae bacterium]|nr:hypothetical protein [Gemmataceae bacterium]
MADTNHAGHLPSVGTEDLMGVRSRISWGAILAGSVLALALYFLLTLLGGAIGLSVSDNVDGRNLATGAAIYAILVTALSLFVGGLVAAQLTTGENKREAALYGLLVWAAVFAMLLWLMASGVRAGFNAMVGVATAGATAGQAAAQNTTAADWEALAQRAGYTPQQIESFKQQARTAPAQVGAAAQDPATRQQAEQAARDAGEAATRVTWYTFLGVLVSMLAAAAGGYVGAGPTFRLFAVPVGGAGYSGGYGGAARTAV